MLNPIKEEHYTGSGTRQIRRLGKFELSEAKSGFTFALFVKKAEAESDYYQILFARDEKASANHYELYLNPANELCFYGPFGDYHSGLVLDDTDWHFVSLRYDGAELVFAVDGEETSVTASSIALADGAAPLTLGELAEPTGGMPFAGMLDCLAVFRRSLTDNELQQLAVNLATTLSQNGSYVSAIAESGGTYQVETTYTAAEGGLYIAAAYENGRLLALSAADQTQATLTVPANGGHVTVKAFFLQGGAGIAPLAPAANK